MTDYAASLFNAQDQQAPAPAVQPVVDYAASLFGGDTGQQAPKVTNKDLTYDNSKTLGFLQQAKGSFAPDEQAWVRFAAKELYPSEPLDQAVKRFGKTEGGRYFHRGDDGKTYEVQPPSGIGRLANIGSGVGEALPVGGGVSAGIASAPAAATGVGLLATMGAAGAGAGAGELARQQIGRWILGEDVAPDLNVPNVVKEGGMSAFGQGIGTGVARYMERYAAPDIARFNQQATNRLYQDAGQVGVRLTPAEATGLASQIAEQKRLAGVPEAANVMADFYKSRNQEATGAFNRLLGSIGAPQDAAILGSKANDAAEAVLRSAQQARTKAVDPFYKAAEKDIPYVNPQAALDFINQELPTAKGSVKQALEYAQKQLMRTGTNAVDTSFKGLDNAKKAIDALMNSRDLASREGIDRTAFGALQGVKDRLVQAIEGAAGNNGNYQAGRQWYKQYSEGIVDPVTDALGPLLKQANADNPNYVQTAKMLFDPRLRSPEQVAAARGLLEKQNPDLWNSLVRQHMQQTGAQALKVWAGGEQRNVAGNIAKAFDEGVTANLKAALSPQQYADFNRLMGVFRAAARATDSNSDTAFKQAAQQLAKRRDMGVAAKTIEFLRPWDKIKAAQDFFAERNYAKQASTIANVITSGSPDALKQLRALQSYGPNDYRRYAILGDLVTRFGGEVADEVLN